MTDWTGQGLPPVAERRIARAAASGVRTSLLSVPSHVGLDVTGFDPVGEVMGCAVMQIGFQGWGGCGWGAMGVGAYGRIGFTPPPMQTATRRSGGYFGLQPFLDSIDQGWALATGRMAEEARRLGADGVLGVRLSEQRLDYQNREFVALGTAVRARGTHHVDRPFSTTLGGVDVAKLMGAGWTPFTVVVANAVGIRHDDWRTVQSRSAWAGNIEVPGYTDLVHATRADCRDELARRARAAGADGAITFEAMEIEFHEVEVAEGHTDHVGVARLVGTAIGAFEGSSQPPVATLAMLPLDGAGRGQR